MNHISEKWGLITSYLAGESSDMEAEELERWIHADPLRSADMDQLRSIWNAFDKLEMDPDMTKEDLESKWEQFAAKMNAVDTSKKTIDPGTSSHHYRKTSRISPLRYVLRIAAVITLMLGAGALISMLFDKPASVNEFTETRQQKYSTAASQIARIQLRDGSNINLSVESSVRLGEDFFSENGQREVFLDGLAFFDVDSTPGSPFLIQTNAGMIKVLGTAFTVRAYSNDAQIQVVVMRGSVSFSTNNDFVTSGILVNAGERVVLDTVTGKIMKTNVDTGNYLKWIEGRIVFEENTLVEVARELERWFGIEFVIRDKSLADRRFSAVLDSKSLNNVLEVIGSTLNIKYTKHDHKVVLENS